MCGAHRAASARARTICAAGCGAGTPGPSGTITADAPRRGETDERASATGRGDDGDDEGRAHARHGPDHALVRARARLHARGLSLLCARFASAQAERSGTDLLALPIPRVQSAGTAPLGLPGRIDHGLRVGWRAPSRARPSGAALLTGRRSPSPVCSERGAAPLGVPGTSGDKLMVSEFAGAPISRAPVQPALPVPESSERGPAPLGRSPDRRDSATPLLRDRESILLGGSAERSGSG